MPRRQLRARLARDAEKPKRDPRRRHVDKYDGLASQPHRARQHFNSNGIMKRCFTEDQALAYVERSEVPTLRAYQCPHCPSWHVGNVKG